MEIPRKNFIDNLRGKSELFNALMFILFGDKDIIFKTEEQKKRELTKAKHKNVFLNFIKKREQFDKPKRKSSAISRYW